MLTDTHTHLYDEAYGGPEGEDAAIRRALEAGVGIMILPDECAKYRQGMIALHRRWPEVTFPCLGLHPTELEGDWKSDLDEIESYLSDGSTEFCAIGETGLDYHWKDDNKPLQEEVFRIQIELAVHYDLPIIIHARDATEDIFRILRDYSGKGLKGVFHAFSGSIETFRRIETLGQCWYVGIGGVLTFKKASIADTVRDIPLERILLETDSPYLSPTPHRGERNESSNIPLIAAFLAERKGIGLEEVAEITTLNAKKLFNVRKNN